MFTKLYFIWVLLFNIVNKNSTFPISFVLSELLVAYSVTARLLDILTPSVEVAHVALFETQQ